MVTIRRYMVPSQAGLDKSLLEAEGIQAFVADENSAALGYGTVLGGVRLQVQDEDVDRAQQILGEQQEAAPLPDDFIPPPEEPPPAEPTKKPMLDDGSAAAFIWGGIAGVAVFAALAVVALVFGGFVFATLGGLTFLFLIGGLVGWAVHVIFPKGQNDNAKNSADK